MATHFVPGVGLVNVADPIDKSYVTNDSETNAVLAGDKGIEQFTHDGIRFVPVVKTTAEQDKVQALADQILKTHVLIDAVTKATKGKLKPVAKDMEEPASESDSDVIETADRGKKASKKDTKYADEFDDEGVADNDDLTESDADDIIETQDRPSKSLTASEMIAGAIAKHEMVGADGKHVHDELSDSDVEYADELDENGNYDGAELKEGDVEYAEEFDDQGFKVVDELTDPSIETGFDSADDESEDASDSEPSGVAKVTDKEYKAKTRMLMPKAPAKDDEMTEDPAEESDESVEEAAEDVEEPNEKKLRTTKHLPGKHDQKTHASRGKGLRLNAAMIRALNDLNDGINRAEENANEGDENDGPEAVVQYKRDVSDLKRVREHLALGNLTAARSYAAKLDSAVVDDYIEGEAFDALRPTSLDLGPTERAEYRKKFSRYVKKSEGEEATEDQEEPVVVSAKKKPAFLKESLVVGDAVYIPQTQELGVVKSMTDDTLEVEVEDGVYEALTFADVMPSLE